MGRVTTVISVFDDEAFLERVLKVDSRDLM